MHSAHRFASATFLVAALTGLAASALPARAGSTTEAASAASMQAPAAAPLQPVLTISGSGRVDAKPDFAVVVLGVDIRAKTAAEAASEAAAATEKILAALRPLGSGPEGMAIKGMKIQTSRVDLAPAYRYSNDNGDQRRTLLGYDATSMIRVRIADPAAIGKVMDVAVAAGANRIEGVQFELADALKARSEALTLAAQAARSKADVLAAALGLRIIGIKDATSTENDNGWRPMSQLSNRVAAEAAGMDGQIEPGTIAVQSSVNVTFLVEPIAAGAAPAQPKR
ncbi:MAG: SIMPL domain-containing protein [Planctomycetaceae bacterium]|jgi:uncharacterized protein YggE|nr:SIMPL domain-containing protein [Planctomycetaceae bacterium]